MIRSLTASASSSSRPPAVFAAVLATVLAVSAALLAGPAAADHVAPARLDGDTRFETAARIADFTYEASRVVFVATGEDYPDALAASFAAGQNDSPILLVGSDVVPDATWEALDELAAESVVIFGGPSVVGHDVDAALQERGYDTGRIAGPTRYETAAHTAVTYGTHVGTIGDDRTAILASGEEFADALAAGPVAAFMHFPLLLTPSHQAHSSVDEALAELEIDRILVVGGEMAVSAAVEQYYRDRGYATERIAGDNRMETSTAVAAFARARLGWSLDLVLLARGDDFPDALAGSVHSAERTAPIVLTASPEVLSDEAASFLRQSCPAIDAIRALGGTEAISIQTLDEAVAEADSCDHRARSAQDFGVAPQEVVTHPPGTTHEFSVFARFDDEPFTGPVDIALFPCDDVAATESPVHFTDADGDRRADGIGHTDADAATIVSVNGTPIDDTTVVRAAEPGEDGNLRFELHSPAVDCAVPVVFDDVDRDGHLDLDDELHAAEPFGVGQIVWTEADGGGT